MIKSRIKSRILKFKKRMEGCGYSVYTKMFDIEFNNKALDMNLFPFTMTRRDKSIKHTSLFYLRISFIKHYSYITVRLFVFIQIGIDFHK